MLPASHRRFAAAAILSAALFPRPGHAFLGFGEKKPAAPPPVAAAASVEGAVQYQAKGTGPWVALAAGRTLAPSDFVKTGAGGKAIIAFSDGTKVQLGANATFQLEALESKKVSVHMAVGLLDAWVAKVKGRRFQVRTPTAVASVRGTQLQVAVDASGHTDVFCFSGALEVAPPSGGRPVEVPAGRQVAADTAGKVTEPAPLPPAKVAPPEPVVSIPEPVKAAPEGEKKEEKKGEKKPEQGQTPPATPAPATAEAPATSEAPGADTTEGTATEPDPTRTSEPPPPPPPNPLQDLQTVSPSSP